MQRPTDHINIVLRARNPSIRRDSNPRNDKPRNFYAERYSADRTLPNRTLYSGVDYPGYYPYAAVRGVPDVRKGRQGHRMDYKHSERVHPSHPGTGDHHNDRIRKLSNVREFSVVRKTVLKLGKLLLPFAVLSTASITLITNKVSAATAASAQGSNGLFGPGPLTKFFLNGDGAVGSVQETAEKMQNLVDTFSSIIMWFKMLPHHVASMSVELLHKVYELLMLVLQTPLFIFNNSYIKDTSMVFAGMSVLIVTILSIIEGNKQMLKLKHTDFKKICKRYFLAIVGAGAAPFLFEKTFQLVNMVTSSITKIGSFGMKEETMIKSLDPGWYDWFNTLALLAFDIMVLVLAVPILLQNGRRFFDLMCLSAVTPLALTAWVFDDYRHMFDKWWYNLKRLGMTPLIYAIYISLLGLFIFGTNNEVSGGGLILKMIIIIGGLSRMANPPSFVKNKVDNGPDVEDSLINTINNMKKAYDTVTLKNIRSLNLAKQTVKKNSQKKAADLLSLRRKHNKRSVKNLK